MNSSEHVSERQEAQEARSQDASQLTDTAQSEHERDNRLLALEKELEAIQEAERERANAPAQKSGFHGAELAWRMVIELVAGVGIGTFIGLGLDGLFGTRPIFLVIFVFFGVAAGFRVVMQTAKEAETQAIARQNEMENEFEARLESLEALEEEERNVEVEIVRELEMDAQNHDGRQS